MEVPKKRDDYAFQIFLKGFKISADHSLTFKHQANVKSFKHRTQFYQLIIIYLK